MLRRNDIKALHGVRGLPEPITGASTGLREWEVVAIHANGTLDARSVKGRSVTVAVRYPRWWEPQLGDRCVLGELQGDERQRVVLQVLCTKTGGTPKVVVV
jgi:hypothetical protein